MNSIIREERPFDTQHVWQINAESFEIDAKAYLVDALKKTGIHYISLVAEIDNQVIGHILFTPVAFSGTPSTLKVLGLTPMAVQKNYQSTREKVSDDVFMVMELKPGVLKKAKEIVKYHEAFNSV